MNNLFDSNIKMSSLEIAELCEKQHRDVMRDIRLLIDKGVILDVCKTAQEYEDRYGRPQPCYLLPFRESMILASGYNATLRAKIIDRWIELERQQKRQSLKQRPVTSHEIIREPEPGQSISYLDTARAQLTAFNQMYKMQGCMLTTIDHMLVAQEDQERRLLTVESDTKQLRHQVDEIRPRDGYLTIAAYCYRNKIRITTEESRQVGLAAAIFCRNQGVEIDEIPDKRYGKVNAYPINMLDDLFALGME